MYGEQARGRYSELTYNRVKAGNVGAGKQPEEHVYNGFLYDRQSKLPLAVVAASTNEKSLGVPTIYHHYAFSRQASREKMVNLLDTPGKEKVRGIPPISSVSALIGVITTDAVASAFSKPDLKMEQVYLQGHTDKFRAAFLADALIDKRAPMPDNLRRKLGRNAFEKLWVKPEESFYHPFKDNGQLPRPFVGVDASTVPVGDLGTEYPEPNNEFYQELYRIWRDEILPSRGVKADAIAGLPKRLQNGSITAKDLEKHLGAYSVFAPELFQIMQEPLFLSKNYLYMDREKSKKFDPFVKGKAVEKDDAGTFRVADNFPLNQATLAQAYFGKALLAKKGPVSKGLGGILQDSQKGGKLDQLAVQLATAVAEIARTGNSGNQRYYGSDGAPVPSVAELAIFGVGPLNRRTMAFAKLIRDVAQVADPEEQINERRQLYLFEKYKREIMEKAFKERKDAKSKL